jgi:hypothetical protein
MKISSFKLLRFLVITLVVGTAILSALQFATEAEAEVLLCTNTGKACDDDGDCTRGNPTCFCAIVAGKGVCREDFAIPPITK